MEKRIREALATPGRPGIRFIAERFGPARGRKRQRSGAGQASPLQFSVSLARAGRARQIRRHPETPLRLSADPRHLPISISPASARLCATSSRKAGRTAGANGPAAR
jgi:hypothetical protein